MGRVRILRVIARLNMGGPAHHVSLLSGHRLDAERFETLLVHGRLAPGEESLERIAARERARTVFVSELMQPLSPADDARALLRLRALVDEYRPHLVHTHTAKAGFLGRQAALSSRRAEPKLVHTFHGHVLEGYFSPPKERAFRALERRLGRRTDRLLGVSQATVDDLVRLGIAEPERFQVLPLGLDLARYAAIGEAERAAARADLGLVADEVLVSFVGRIVPIKRIDVLLTALATARRQGAKLRLALAGDGEMRAELESLAHSLGVAEVVDWLGYRADLRPLTAAADIAAVSSDNEGTPVSLIEAAAAAVPAVATDVGGVSEVVADRRSGLLVPADDSEAFARALAELAAEPERRRKFGAAARERALARYSIDRLLADIDELYTSLLAQTSSRSAAAVI